MASYFFIFSVILLLLNISVKAQNGKTECSKDTLNMCRRNIENVLSGYGEAGRLEVEDQCWRVRRNFDCVLWQTSMCLKQDEQSESRNIITKAWHFLDSFCEEFKNWWTKTCFRTNRLKRCEEMLGSKSSSTDYSSCRSYLRFRDCANSTIENDCSTDDQRLLGVYLMEKGQQRAWNCPKDSESYSYGPINARYASNGRNNHDELPLGDSASATSCLTNINNVQKSCKGTFEKAQEEAKDIVKEDDRKKKLCCAVVETEKCAVQELKVYCGDKAAEYVKTVLSGIKTDEYNCDSFGEATCSGPLSAIVAHAVIIGGVFMSFAIAAFV